MASQITRVARFSTGSVDIHPQHAYRGRSPMYWWILTSRQWLTGRPINIYVVEHTDGVVLFDTGQDRASVTDPSYFPDGPVGLIYRRLARFEVSEDETLTAGLARLGYRPTDVTTAIISHLHQDHIGGVREIPDAELVVSAEEWRSLHRPLADARGLLRGHIDVPGLRWSPVELAALQDLSLAPFTSGRACSATVHSCFSRPRGTPLARCRCSFAAARWRRSCSSATSPTTSTPSRAA
jgi:N-acyl homoserine lactone hydrolase